MRNMEFIILNDSRSTHYFIWEQKTKKIICHLLDLPKLHIPSLYSLSPWIGVKAKVVSEAAYLIADIGRHHCVRSCATVS